MRHDIGSCRNARLNKARRSAFALLALLKPVEGIQKTQPHMDADFWEACRDMAADISQCIHEANAYNNSMVGPNVAFERDTFELPAGDALLKNGYRT